jgi:hypothetical protein
MAEGMHVTRRIWDEGATKPLQHLGSAHGQGSVQGVQGTRGAWGGEDCDVGGGL